MLTKDITEYIQANLGTAKDLLVTLAQIPSPSNHEEKRALYIKEKLESWGIKDVKMDKALNVIIPCIKDEAEPLTVFMAHTDVVFPDEEPLPYKQDGDRMCCPGIGDDTANVVSLMLCMKYVFEKNLKPEKGGILFVLNSGEEGLGNLKGSRQIVEDYGDRIERFYSFDGYLSGITNRAVGSSRMKVTVNTKGGHSYSAFGNENAIRIAAGMIEDIYKIKVPEEGKTTYNVGTITGGTSVNTIAENAEFLCEYRSDRQDALLYMEKRFTEIFEKYKQTDAMISVENVGIRPCEILEDRALKVREEMLKNAEEIIREYTGAYPKRGPSSTDCNIPLSRGIPAVCFGTVSGAGAHTRGEYVLMSSLETGYKTAMNVVLQYFDGTNIQH